MPEKRLQILVTTGAVLAAALLLLMPPFMVIDPAAAQTRHAALGHHPFWQPPTPEFAEQALSRIAAPPPGQGRILRIGVNRVRLTMEMGTAALAALVLLAVERGYRRRTGRERAEP